MHSVAAIASRITAALRAQRDRWLLAGAAIAIAVCFLRPAWTVERQLTDQVIVLDITQSMNVEDEWLAGKPVSRLAFAKVALRDALVRLPCGSKIGWGVFTEYRSFLLLAPVEVCANLTELRTTLSHIDGRMAWTGNSEIAKGLYSGIGIAKQLADVPSLVFITDGQEAPPLSPRHRPPFNGKPGEVKGLVVGVGDLKPSPIPKSDPSGRPLGFWGADEVMQTDPRSQGRGSSVGGEQLVEDAPADLPDRGALGATPGSEHLSSLREAYLRLLAGETGLGFHRLQDEEAFIAAIAAPGLTRPATARADLRPVCAGLALLLLILRYAAQGAAWVQNLFDRRRGGRRRKPSTPQRLQ